MSCFFRFTKFYLSALFHIICNFGMFVPTKKKSIFSVQHFITVCNIVCANGGNICISIKYIITIVKHVAEFHVYFS